MVNVYPIASAPNQVIQAVELGFDLFSGTYPYLLTQRNQAMSLSYDLDQVEAAKEEEENEPPRKMKKVEDETNREVRAEKVSPSNSDGVILDLTDVK